MDHCVQIQGFLSANPVRLHQMMDMGDLQAMRDAAAVPP